MKLVRGTNVYPRAIEGIVHGFDGVEEFQIQITREGLRDEITLFVKMGREVDETACANVSLRINPDLAEAHEGLNFRVQRAEAGTPPRVELKSKRVIDLRDASRGARDDDR